MDRSLEEELHMLLPVLLSHAPRIRMKEVSGALLRTSFAPSLLHVCAMNDPVCLERLVEGVCLVCGRCRGGAVLAMVHVVAWLLSLVRPRAAEPGSA